MRATDSTHCSSGVDTNPPGEIFSAYRRGTQGLKSLRIASGRAGIANLKSLRHAGEERKMHPRDKCRRENVPCDLDHRLSSDIPVLCPALYHSYTLSRNVCTQV